MAKVLFVISPIIASTSFTTIELSIIPTSDHSANFFLITFGLIFPVVPRTSPKVNFIASITLALVPICPCIKEKNIAVSKFLVCVIKDKTVLLNCAVVLAANINL